MDSDQFASFAVLWNGIHMDLFRNAGQNYSVLLLTRVPNQILLTKVDLYQYISIDSEANAVQKRNLFEAANGKKHIFKTVG